MTCENYRELVSADLDGELQPAEDVSLYEHLTGCADCREWRRDQLTIRADLHRRPHEALPPVLDQPPIPATLTPRNGYRIPRVWAWAAAILLLVQSTVTISNYLTRPLETPMVFEDESDEIETIELTDNDRTRYAVQSNPVKIPTANPANDGG